MAYANTIEDQFGGGEAQPGSSWRLFIFLLILFSATVLAFFGLKFGYRTFLTNSISDLDAQIKISAENLELEERQDLVAFYSQIVNLQRLLRDHVFGSRLFAFLEANTNLRVAYSTLNLSVPERQITIDGVAGNFENLVQQLVRWEDAPEVESLVLEENAVTNDMVRFRVRLVFVPSFFKVAAASPAASGAIEENQ